jgi:hypothetical protein
MLDIIRAVRKALFHYEPENDERWVKTYIISAMNWIGF